MSRTGFGDDVGPDLPAQHPELQGCGDLCGALGGTRTPNLLIRSQMLGVCSFVDRPNLPRMHGSLDRIRPQIFLTWLSGWLTGSFAGAQRVATDVR